MRCRFEGLRWGIVQLRFFRILITLYQCAKRILHTVKEILVWIFLSIQGAWIGFEDLILCVCVCEGGRSCPDLQNLEKKRLRQENRYRHSAVRLLNLRNLASAYRAELCRLRATRLNFGKTYLGIIKSLEESWNAELQEKSAFYNELLKVKRSLKGEIRMLQGESADLDDETCSSVSLPILDFEEKSNRLRKCEENDSTDESDSEYHEAEEMDLKMKICFLIQQSLFSNSGALSLLIKLDVESLSPDFRNLCCIAGIILGTMRYLEYIDCLYEYLVVEGVFSRVDLLVAHFAESQDDQLVVLDEIYFFCSESEEKLGAYLNILTAVFKLGIVDAFALSEWINKCKDKSILKVSIPLLTSIYNERSPMVQKKVDDAEEHEYVDWLSHEELFHGSLVIQTCPQDQLSSEYNIEFCPRVERFMNTFMFFNHNLSFSRKSILSSSSPINNCTKSTTFQNTPKTQMLSSSMRKCFPNIYNRDHQSQPRIRKTVSFDTTTSVIS